METSSSETIAIKSALCRLENMKGHSLEENVSFSAGLWAAVQKSKKILDISSVLHILFLLAGGWGFCILILLSSLDEAGILVLPEILHNIFQSDDTLLPCLGYATAIVLIPFPLDILLAIVKRFVPTKVQTYSDSDLENNLSCLKDNLQKSKNCDSLFGIFDGSMAIIFTPIPTLLFAISILIGEMPDKSNYGGIIGLVFFTLLISALFGLFSFAYSWVACFLINFWVGNILSRFGMMDDSGSYSCKERLNKLLLQYPDYAEQIRMGDMTPDQLLEYQNNKVAQQEEEQRRLRLRKMYQDEQQKKEEARQQIHGLYGCSTPAHLPHNVSYQDFHRISDEMDMMGLNEGLSDDM